MLWLIYVCVLNCVCNQTLDLGTQVHQKVHARENEQLWRFARPLSPLRRPCPVVRWCRVWWYRCSALVQSVLDSVGTVLQSVVVQSLVVQSLVVQSVAVQSLVVQSLVLQSLAYRV